MSYYKNDRLIENYKNTNFNNPYNVNTRIMQKPKRWKYSIGDLVQVINTNLQVNIIRIGNEQYQCELPNGSTQWFYEEELELVNNPIARSFKYSIGMFVHIINTNINATIIRIGREQYKCRLPDMNTQWFYEEELEPVS